MSIDYGDARDLLAEAFEQAESAVLAGSTVELTPKLLARSIDRVFASGTQAYREVLLGCLLARILDKSVDVTSPYVSQGDNAYSGRTLDERVINPILQNHRIPSSRGPFLSVFRRSVQFIEETRDGLRDKDGYDALLIIITWIETTADDARLTSLLGYLAFRFIRLRESSTIELARIQRMSLEQIVSVAQRLLAASTGGLMPVYIVVAGLRAINSKFELGWEVSFQGINVADSARGVGGDVTVVREGEEILVAEITERVVDSTRVNNTFSSKIAPNAIRDYLFFITGSAPDSGALASARRYFAQGHEIDFVVIDNWLHSTLATIGQDGRNEFAEQLLRLLDLQETSAAVRHLWNESVAAALQEN